MSLLTLQPATLNGVLVFALRFELPKIFSNDPAVISLAAQVLIIVAAIQPGDNLQAVCSGILRGTGQQKVLTFMLTVVVRLVKQIGAWVNFIGYYFVGLPLGIFLTFKTPLGALGLWLGLAPSIYLQVPPVLAVRARADAPQVCGFTTIIFRTNWKEQAARAAQRCHEVLYCLLCSATKSP